MLKKLRARLKEISNQKHKNFEDFDNLIRKIANSYDSLFPNFTRNCKGSHYSYNFGIQGYFPFTVVKEHGSWEHQSHKAAKGVINKIADILDYIEANVSDDEETASEGDLDHESTNNVEEASGPLPEPEIPNGDQ
jgi:hypothetical protein